MWIHLAVDRSAPPLSTSFLARHYSQYSISERTSVVFIYKKHIGWLTKLKPEFVLGVGFQIAKSPLSNGSTVEQVIAGDYWQVQFVNDEVPIYVALNRYQCVSQFQVSNVNWPFALAAARWSAVDTSISIQSTELYFLASHSDKKITWLKRSKL